MGAFWFARERGILGGRIRRKTAVLQFPAIPKSTIFLPVKSAVIWIFLSHRAFVEHNFDELIDTLMTEDYQKRLAETVS